MTGRTCERSSGRRQDYGARSGAAAAPRIPFVCVAASKRAGRMVPAATEPSVLKMNGGG